MSLLLLLLAHLLADFTFQTDKIAREKSLFNKQMSLHVLIHLITTEAIMTLYSLIGHHQTVRWLLIGFVIVLAHFVVDNAKSWLYRQNPWGPPYAPLAFLTDQLAHLICIWMGWFFLAGPTSLDGFLQFIGDVLNQKSLGLSTVDHVIIVVIILILATSFSGILVGMVVEPLPKTGPVVIEHKVTETLIDAGRPEKKDERTFAEVETPSISRGRRIGYLERLIILFLIYVSGYQAIGFIVAAKSLIRFRQLDHRDWAEYFLIGTLSSMLLGLVCGYLMKALLL